VTSNKAPEQWGEIFLDDVIATAILDRLLHHSYPFFIQDKSYRMKALLDHDNAPPARRQTNSATPEATDTTTPS
jgi:hypothetical protein